MSVATHFISNMKTIGLLTACFTFAQCSAPSPSQENAHTSPDSIELTRDDGAQNQGPKDAHSESKTPKQRARKPLTLNVDNLKSPTAPVIVGLYGIHNKFPDPKDQLKEYRFVPNGDQLTVEITDIEYGVFAIALYQDVNGDGKINKNMLGVPTEPYAFSNNVKPVVKAPQFKNCKFEYNDEKNVVNIHLLHGK